MVDLIVTVWIDLIGSRGGFLARLLGMATESHDEKSGWDGGARKRPEEEPVTRQVG
jgi:hypothetical protein